MGQVMKLTKWHNFVVCDLRRFVWGESCKISQPLARFRFYKRNTLRNYVSLLQAKHTTKLCNFVHFIFCVKHNFDWRKKEWSTDSVMTPVYTNQSVIKCCCLRILRPETPTTKFRFDKDVNYSKLGIVS